MENATMNTSTILPRQHFERALHEAGPTNADPKPADDAPATVRLAWLDRALARAEQRHGSRPAPRRVAGMGGGSARDLMEADGGSPDLQPFGGGGRDGLSETEHAALKIIRGDGEIPDKLRRLKELLTAAEAIAVATDVAESVPNFQSPHSISNFLRG